MIPRTSSSDPGSCSHGLSDGLSDLECPRCGGAIRDLSCEACSAVFPKVLGVPFIGDFEAADALGLIEIVAHAPIRSTLSLDPADVINIDRLCAGYHAAKDKQAFCAAHEEAQAWWFGHRFSEWLAVQTLLEGHDLNGKSVLDIGAGAGFDAWRLALRGAKVTALEFSPILAEVGAQSFPSLRWIGGFAHALPFRTASFDYVFINAALHHMRDLPATIAEALRVIVPGGMLITTGDPFRADKTPQTLEFDVFDRHEGVLLGINEQIPRTSEFLKTLERNRAVLAPEVFTQVLHGGRSGYGSTLNEWTGWDLDADAALLKARAGSLAMRIRLLAPWPHPRALQRDGILPPSTFAAWLDDPLRAVAELARIMPPELINTPFPGRPAKFDLVNGWRVAQSTGTTRTGYRRARLFRSAVPGKTLHFEMRSPVAADFTFRVNARPVGKAQLSPAWSEVAVDLSTVGPGEPCVLEFQREGEPENFDAGCFEVRLPGAKPDLAARIRGLLPKRLRRWAGVS